MWFVIAFVALSALVATAWAWRSVSTRAKALTPPEATSMPAAPGSGNENTIGTAVPVGASSASAASASASLARPTAAASISADTAAKAGERVRNNAARTVKVETQQTPPAAQTSGTPDPVEAAAPQPESKPVAPVVTPEKLCADSNFLTRPMCLYRACQRPDLAGIATCVALEQNLKRGAEVNRQ